MYKEIVVCEGTHDVIKIQSVYKDLPCIITNGSEISKETLMMIKELSQKYRIICFLDPDSPGERIRSKIVDIVPNAIHAYIKKSLCISYNRKKVGVEHASDDDIKSTLDPLLSKTEFKMGELTINDLYDLNIVGNKDIRLKLADMLNIGKPNNKTMLKRLNMLNITKDSLRKMVGEINA